MEFGADVSISRLFRAVCAEVLRAMKPDVLTKFRAEL
jgi:hypothetical protein